MTDTEEPQFNSLKDRIAALNQQKNFNSSEPARKPPPPAPPVRPAAAETRSKTAPAVPVNGSVSRATPDIPQRPVKPKAAPPPLPRRDTQSSQGETPQEERRAPPPLPGRTNSSQAAPPLLPRRTSTQPNALDQRRGSTSSEVSQRSTGSNLSQAKTISSVTSQGSDGRKLPPSFNQSSLPPLPPTRREREAREQEEAARQAARPRPALPATKSTSDVNGTSATAPTQAPKPGLPPRLPSRPTSKPSPAPEPEPETETPDPYRHQRPPSALKGVPITGFSSKAPVAKKPSAENQPPLEALKSAKITGFGGGSKGKARPQANRQTQQEKPPPLPETSRDDNTPPPIPVTSRPSATQIDAANARVVARAEEREDCFPCRDWSEPDRVAAQYPRETLPRNDVIGYLAQNLCGPFASYTDKARAIFTWFHHNIAYDTVSFFGNCVKHMKPEDTIFTGLAVCQGYAETYKTIANRAGLECVVVGGHGKGFGHAPLKPGERCPPQKPDGHAWNAVRIDGGRWKLLDACWGAGHLDTGTNTYKKEFSPAEFNRTNEQFGVKHFPREPSYQFREDGRTLTWEEYFMGPNPNIEPVTVFGHASREGILESSVEPKELRIPVNSGRVVRFQFSNLCPHWKSEIHGAGKPPLLILSIHGVDGRKDDWVPMETDGYWHWLDVHARDLGAPGQTVGVCQASTVGGKDARGMTVKEYYANKGRGMGAMGVHLRWELI